MTSTQEEMLKYLQGKYPLFVTVDQLWWAGFMNPHLTLSALVKRGLVDVMTMEDGAGRSFPPYYRAKEST